MANCFEISKSTFGNSGSSGKYEWQIDCDILDDAYEYDLQILECRENMEIPVRAWSWIKLLLYIICINKEFNSVRKQIGNRKLATPGMKGFVISLDKKVWLDNYSLSMYW